MPDLVYPPYGKRIKSYRSPVDIELHPGFPYLNIDYASPTSGNTTREVQPVGMRLLKEGQVALIARCKLRDDLRTFSLSRIMAISLPQKSGSMLTTSELAAFLAPDIRRLAFHDTTINGPAPACHATAFTSHKGQCSHLRDLPATGLRSELRTVCQAAREYATLTLREAQLDHGAFTVSILGNTDRYELHVDGPAASNSQFRNASNHAKLAHLGRRAALTAAAKALLTAAPSALSWRLERAPMQISFSLSSPVTVETYTLALQGIILTDEPAAPDILADTLMRACSPPRAMQKMINHQWEVVTPTGYALAFGNTQEDAMSDLLSLTDRARIFLGSIKQISPIGNNLLAA